MDSRRRAEQASSGGGTKKSLGAWADESGIPKTTLFYRVAVKGLSTAEPLALGRSTKKRRRPRAQAASGDCELAWGL